MGVNRDDAKRAGVVRHYQYRCPPTGAVKAYKQMTGAEARVLNERLAARGSWGYWVLISPQPDSAAPTVCAP